jgi:hypothetical protein
MLLEILPSGPDLWWIILGVVALLPYWLGPLWVYLSQRVTAAPRFDRYDAASHPWTASITTAVEETSAALIAEGFVQVADLFHAGSGDGVGSRIVLFEKSATGQEAMCVGSIVTVAEGTRKETRTTACWLELIADFSDGRSLLVNNSATIGAFARVPGKIVEQFPTVRDPARLVAIHERLIERTRGDTALVRRPRTVDILEHMVAAFIREIEAQVPLGYFRLDPAANAYRPTVRAAVLMCWKLLPPWSLIRQQRRSKREARLLAELGTTGPDAQPVTAPALETTHGKPQWRSTRAPSKKVSWAGLAAVAVVAAYVMAMNMAPARAIEPAAPTPVVPLDLNVPSDFPGAVRALEGLADGVAGPLMVRDTLGVLRKASGASIAVSAQRADSLIAGVQRAFLARGFFLFRHESNYGLNGKPDQLALVPMWDQYRVVKTVGTSSERLDISNAELIEWLRALERDAPFVLTGIGGDHVEGRFIGVLSDADAMARRLYEFCPDIVNQGTGSVSGLASELRRRKGFSCWWD